MRIADQFCSIPSPLRNRGILGDVLTFLMQSPTDFTTLGEMTDADTVMNPPHFGSDPDPNPD